MYVRPIKEHINCTINQKELHCIMKLINPSKGMFFGYEINAFSHHKNMVYTDTLCEYQWVMCWRLFLEDFEPNIQHTYM